MSRLAFIIFSLYFLGNSLLVSSTTPKYMGCFDAWKSRIVEFTTTGFLEIATVDTCRNFCVENGFGQKDISILQGQFCGCHPWTENGLVKVDENACSLNCPGSLDTCGGNHAISLYCNSTDARCKNFEVKDFFLKEFPREDKSKSLTDYPMKGFSLGKENGFPALPCFNCTNHFDCYVSSFSPKFAYIPGNTPAECIRFCSTDWEYYNRLSGAIDIRERTKYANVGWTYRGGFTVPSCGCYDQLPSFDPLPPPQYCQKPCPIDPDQLCGGEPPFYYTLYFSTTSGIKIE